MKSATDIKNFFSSRNTLFKKTPHKKTKTGRIKKDAAGRSYDFRLDTVALRPCLSTSLLNKYITIIPFNP